MLCKDCKYWKSLNSKNSGISSDAIIDAVSEARWSGCMSLGICEGMDRGKGDNYMGLCLDAADDTNLSGDLVTGADFGCTLGEIKND